MKEGRLRGWIRWVILGGVTILAIVGIVIVTIHLSDGAKKDATEEVSQQDIVKDGQKENSKPVVENPLEEKTSEKEADLPKSGPEEWSWLEVLALGGVVYGLTFGVGELTRKNRLKREI